MVILRIQEMGAFFVFTCGIYKLGLLILCFAWSLAWVALFRFGFLLVVRFLVYKDK